MYKRILAAVNEHTNSEAAARYATAMAKTCGARLVLAYVSAEPIDRNALKKAEAAIQRLFIDAQEAGIDVMSLALKGDPVKKLVEHAKAQATDIVFAATRHEYGHRRLFDRTVSRELMVKLPCAAAVVRVAGMGRPSPGDILLPLRGGLAFNEERAYFAANLARAFGARITLLHTPEPTSRFFQGELHLTPAEREERIPADIRELAAYLDSQGVASETLTARGSASRAITTEAAIKRSGLIVMGASQRGMLAGLLKGSPVEEILRHAPCSLMIFRPRRTAI